MDKERAKEIAASPVLVDVTYNGDPIYIEAINEMNDTARIHSLDEPQNKQEVSLTNLIEH